MHGTKVRSLVGQLLEAPTVVWVVLGFLASFFFFFINPVFLTDGTMQFPTYVPAAHPIGADLRIFLHYITVWLARGSQAVGPSPYPPAARLLFAPLVLVKPNTAYALMTVVTVLCYVLITMVVPLKTSKAGHFSAIAMFFLITGLLSYGFQFELERGQFNVVAACFCFLAIWIYHYRPGIRYLAYLLFTVSVQLKVYPFLFVIMLIRDWRDWKHNVRRMLTLAAANAALLLALGPAALGDSLRGLTSQMSDPYVWMGNHSVRSFVTLTGNYASAHGWTWLRENTRLVELASVAAVLVCVFLIVLQAYRKRLQGLNSRLLLACTLAALLLPAASQDYKLSILAAPCAVLFCAAPFMPPRAGASVRLRIIFPVLMIIFSIAYSSTLFSFTNKPSLLQNNFPSLLAMLLTVTCLSLVFDPGFGQTAQAIGAIGQKLAAVDVAAARTQDPIG